MVIHYLWKYFVQWFQDEFHKTPLRGTQRGFASEFPSKRKINETWQLKISHIPISRKKIFYQSTDKLKREAGIDTASQLKLY